MSDFVKGKKYSFSSDMGAFISFEECGNEDEKVYVRGDLYIRPTGKEEVYRYNTTFFGLTYNVYYTCISENPLVLDGPLEHKSAVSSQRGYDVLTKVVGEMFKNHINLNMLQKFLFNKLHFEMSNWDLQENKVKNYILNFIKHHFDEYGGSSNGAMSWHNDAWVLWNLLFVDEQVASVIDGYVHYRGEQPIDAKIVFEDRPDGSLRIRFDINGTICTPEDFVDLLVYKVADSVDELAKMNSSKAGKKGSINDMLKNAEG